MVLYLQEYAEQKEDYAKTLNYYDKLPTYLHEMSAEEIFKEMNRNGARSFYSQKFVINRYLAWLNLNYNIDIRQLYFDLNNSSLSKNFEFVGFYSFKDLQKGIQNAELTIETLNTADKDFNGLYAIFYLEWLGILPEAALSIRLEDVTNLGKSIYIPAENRTIEVNNDYISDYFWGYKNTTGRKRTDKSTKETPYTQNTFYRSIAKGDIKIKSVYNIRGFFVKYSGDERFAKKRVYYSGRYNEMYQAEINYG